MTSTEQRSVFREHDANTPYQPSYPHSLSSREAFDHHQAFNFVTSFWDNAPVSPIAHPSPNDLLDDLPLPLSFPASPFLSSSAVAEASSPRLPREGATSPLSAAASSPSPAPGAPGPASTTSPSASASSDSPTAKRARVVVAEPVKRTHREADTDRRHREVALVRRLDALLDEDGSGSGAAVHSHNRKRKVHPARKRERVEVLQACADKLERLQALVDRLMEAPNAKDARVHALAQHLQEMAELHERSQQPLSSSSSALSLLPAQSSKSLRYLDEHHALYSSMFCRTAVALVLLDFVRGIILDANPSARTAPSCCAVSAVKGPHLSVAVLCACVCQSVPATLWLAPRSDRGPHAGLSHSLLPAARR